MKNKPVKDVAASVRQRLLNAARDANRPFQEVLQYFAMERFLYRLSVSPHAKKFTLKGALMLTVWRGPTTRPTKDIDFLAKTDNTVDAIVPIVRDICNQPVEADGLAFDADSVIGEIIKEDADYSGVRVTFRGNLQNARVAMQIDMGFGDVVTPAAKQTDYPAMLDFPAPRLLGYNRETMVAEKFEAMIKLGEFNSRLKDFYNIWLVSRQFDFDGSALATAVAKTFAHRGTTVELQPAALTDAFAKNPAKSSQWTGFIRKSKLGNVSTDLSEVIDELRVFLMPLAAALNKGTPFDKVWPARGPWQQRSE